MRPTYLKFNCLRLFFLFSQTICFSLENYQCVLFLIKYFFMYLFLGKKAIIVNCLQTNVNENANYSKTQNWLANSF